ncbi:MULTISPECIES: lipopolysaccharide biosynthesis protein [Bizionia]|uniref:Oligosaccharide flippase family protein n=1 Tax=Bizionia algoritergicola TaxID=291187 RepID=A0A5D0QWC0_9FLAO|nr:MULTISPECIES: polysaccharide biosynthesis C-terminal domain-containing protein [Bizionia]OBX23999.1 sugar isomerase [Bizionia sp. APA-3]TYB73507.1 oligosaccharide flippase family protein [Bizionia algoritergicola]
MGIVTSQSIKNTLITYLGFGLGAINVLFLFTEFISDEYFGLITYIFSTANVMMPILAFGVHNTLIKFYSTYKTRQTQNGFLILMLFLPLAIIIPTAIIGYFAFDVISTWLSGTNTIVADYVWLIFISAVAFSYFEVFYAWSRVQMQSVFGNFMKEVFHRAGTMILLFCLYLGFIDVEQLIYSITGIYIIRVVIMKLYAFSLRFPSFNTVKIPNLSSVLKYTSLIIIAGSVANVILEVDKFMLNRYVAIEYVAYYGVAIYIASVIGVPSRSMHQIISPLTAKLLNERNRGELGKLYKKSSLSLFIISGFIFLLIILNINELYNFINENYADGILVVFVISLSKLTDSLLGNNNAILFNSDYYRMVLVLGVFLAVLTVVLNMVFIPIYGINGAAFATFLSILLYNLAKLCFVHIKLKMQPFTINTVKVLVLIIVNLGVFYFWDFPWHPILNIGLKSFLITAFYGTVVYTLHFSEDITQLINTIIKRIKRENPTK